MTDFAEGRVTAAGFEIRYVEAGDGPPLACFHGAGGLRLRWDAFVAPSALPYP